MGTTVSMASRLFSLSVVPVSTISTITSDKSRIGASSTAKIVAGVKEDEHKCVNCGNCKNHCAAGNVEIRKKLY